MPKTIGQERSHTLSDGTVTRWVNIGEYDTPSLEYDPDRKVFSRTTYHGGGSASEEIDRATALRFLAKMYAELDWSLRATLHADSVIRRMRARDLMEFVAGLERIHVSLAELPIPQAIAELDARLAPLEVES